MKCNMSGRQLSVSVLVDSHGSHILVFRSREKALKIEEPYI